MQIKQGIAVVVALAAGVGSAVAVAGGATVAKPTLTIVGANRAVESAGSGIITVSGQNFREQTVVTVIGRGGSATPGTDFRTKNQTLTINGTAFRTGTIPAMDIIDDRIHENDETVGITISGADGSVLAARPFTIVDDDSLINQLLCQVAPGFVDAVLAAVNRVSHDVAMNSIRNCK